MEREGSQYIVETSLIHGYISNLISEMRHGIHVPLVHYILSNDPSIQRHEIEYMPIPLGPVGR